MARIRREETAFPSSPDPRFGGNMARANEGAQYRGSPRYEHGAYLKGSPMHDAQYGNYVAPHRVDYTRNAPPQSSGTPNFRPPYGAPGKPSYNEWLQQIDPFHTGPYPPKKHPNPRMRGMGGGLGGLQVAYSPGDFSGPIRRPRIKPLTIEEEELDLLDILEGLDPGDELDPDEYYSDGWDVADTGIGSTNEYQQMAGALDPDVALDILGDPNRNMDSILQIYGDDSWDNLPAFKIGDKWYGNPALGMPGKMGSGWNTA